MNELETLKKKIIYRSSYRGTKEMDILLSSFVKNYIEKLSETELKILYEFLNYEDEDLLNFYQNKLTINVIKDDYISQIFKKFKL